MGRRPFWVNVAAAGVGVLWSVGVALSSQLLLQSIAILLIAAAVFLRPRTVAILALVFLGIAAAAIATLNVEEPWLQAGNAVLACLLAVLISATREDRIGAIERVRAHEAAVLGSCADAILVVDADGVLRQANLSASKMLPAAVLGEPFHPVLEHRLENGEPCPGDCALAGVPAERHERGESINTEQGRIHVEYVAAPIDPDLSVISLRDVSERVAADEDRRALLESALRLREQSRKVVAFGSARGAVDPGVPEVELDLWSIPAGPDIASGSDLVDVSRMPDGRIAFLLVDGLDRIGLTTEQAWTVLYVTRAFLFAGVPLADVVERTALTLAAQHDPPRASVLAGTFEPGTGRTAVVIGGQPPPLVVRSNGAVEWLASVGAPIGVPRPASAGQGTAETVLLPGDRLVLYTDGVIDGDQDLVEALSSLRSAATARRYLRGAGWARGLLEAVLPGGTPADDATVLALCRPPLDGLVGLPASGDARSIA